jgi:predicted nuclease with TOPRIM domain
VEEIITENRYLNKKMKGKEEEVRELREKCERLERENRGLEEERNLLMREKLNMGIEIARLNE